MQIFFNWLNFGEGGGFVDIYYDAILKLFQEGRVFS